MRLTTALLAASLLVAIAALASGDAEEESLSWGCSGGFTGGGGGIVVHRDGEIFRWSRPSFRDAVERSFLRSDGAAARSLFEEVQRIGFTSIHYNDFGNMTCSIVLRRDASTHAVEWPMDDPAAPSEVVALAARMERLAERQPAEQE